MQGMDGYPAHPARDMAIRSMTLVEAGDGDAWLDLWADDGVVEDPIGISSFVSLGNKSDVSANDFLNYWDDDPDTSVVLMYTESFGNPRKFGRIARRGMSATTQLHISLASAPRPSSNR